MTVPPEPQRRISSGAAKRRRAALAGHAGDAVTARALLADTEPAVRATALGALARAGKLTAADLITGLTDPSPHVRRRVAELVAEQGSHPDDDSSSSVGGRAQRRAPWSSVSLLGLLDDADSSVVEVAAWACGERRPTEPGTVDRLSALATAHDDSLVREASVAALGAIGDAAGLAAILAATADKATVRRRAVLALAPFDGPEVGAALQRARSDRDAQVRQAAEDLTEG